MDKTGLKHPFSSPIHTHGKCLSYLELQINLMLRHVMVQEPENSSTDRSKSWALDSDSDLSGAATDFHQSSRAAGGGECEMRQATPSLCLCYVGKRVAIGNFTGPLSYLLPVSAESAEAYSPHSRKEFGTSFLKSGGALTLQEQIFPCVKEPCLLR